jgi:NDP-sugar pyrophosphorylase family protein
MNIIFSLCGKGQRFADVGFKIPKYLIAYNGAPMLYHSVETLGLKGNIHFIVKKSHLQEHKTLEKFLLTLGDEIIAIDGDTGGAAESILLAEDYIKDKSLPLISANGDQFMDWDSELFERQINSDPKSSYIVTFKSESVGCSYARTNENGLVTEVREKKLISNDATVGIYHWAKSEYFFKDAKKMMEDGVKDNNEYYVAPVYNYTLQHNDVKLYQLQSGEFSPIGTPKEYHTFTGKNKFFT